jgi:hypothetical protein
LTGFTVILITQNATEKSRLKTYIALSCILVAEHATYIALSCILVAEHATYTALGLTGSLTSGVKFAKGKPLISHISDMFLVERHLCSLRNLQYIKRDIK